MEDSYFSISERETGFYQVLRLFRTEISLATRKHYPNLEVVLEGNVPSEVREQLPIFGLPGFLPSDFYALNSGGRGILLSDGNTHLRFKGNDVNGVITRTVARSKNNHNPDVTLVAGDWEGFDFDTRPLDYGEVYRVPAFEDKPFSFITRAAVEMERHACEALGAAFERGGFLRPYTFEGIITYPTIHWDDKPCSTMVFGLPSIESDLRFGEVFRLGFLHLRFASPEELQDIHDDLSSFLTRLATWHGFVTATIAEEHLAPTPASHQNLNYVLCHVNSSEIGATRVDHTSTVVDKAGSAQYVKKMKEEASFFSTLEVILLHALELARQGYVLDEERYAGYFDRAYKWFEELDIMSIPGTERCIIDALNAFGQGFERRDPTPIPEKELIDLVARISQIRIDEARQRRIIEKSNRILGIK